MKHRDICKYYIALLAFFFLGLFAQSQSSTIPDKSFRNNQVKLNLLPLFPAINGNNQKWMGFEYERFLNQRMSLSFLADIGLFEDYTYKKYHDFFDEYGGFSYTQNNVQTHGYHFIPSFKYYFLITKKKKGQGFYVAGNMDFNQYFKKSEVYHSLTKTNNTFNYSTTRMGIGASLGGQYVAFSRLVVDLNISFFTTIFTVNSGADVYEIRPLNAIWLFNNDQSWGTVNLMVGYAFGGGKKK